MRRRRGSPVRAQGRTIEGGEHRPAVRQTAVSVDGKDVVRLAGTQALVVIISRKDPSALCRAARLGQRPRHALAGDRQQPWSPAVNHPFRLAGANRGPSPFARLRSARADLDLSASDPSRLIRALHVLQLAGPHEGTRHNCCGGDSQEQTSIHRGLSWRLAGEYQCERGGRCRAT